MYLLLHSWLVSNAYIPHGHCYLWQTPLVGLHVTADALIAIAYYSIPLILIYFVRQSDELPFKNIFLLFGAFILSCGTTHLAEIWTLWHPNYWLYGGLKAVTALISLYTAFSLIPIVPNVLELASPQKLSTLNEQLNEQILANKAAKQKVEHLNQELEARVAEKTDALVKANQDLQTSTQFRQQLTDLTPNILYIFDLVAQKNIYCNPFITELLGYTPTELQKFKDGVVDELIHPEDLPILKEHFGNCILLEEEQYLEVEYRIKSNSGQWHWLHDKNAVFSRDSDGKAKQILGIAQDITQAKKNQFQTQQLNQKLESQIAVLEMRDRASRKLAKLNEFVQVCTSLEEAQQVIADLLKPLFFDSAGTVYLASESKNILNAIATWGDSYSHDRFEPKECWAIRRGDIHLSDPDASNLFCSHIVKEKLTLRLCLPMIARGETIGMLHLNFPNAKTIDRSTQDLAETVAQNLALSFANLKLQQKLRYQSLRDPLMGLYNRRYLQEAFEKELDRASRKQQSVSVMMLDVDYFKRFNDVYGHAAGDLVLSKVGAYISSTIRQYDVACRYGGEELIIIMPDVDIDNAILCAERIRTGIKNMHLKHDGRQLDSISISIGIACYPDNGSDAEGLIRAADKALYQAKESGRDCVRQYE